MTSAPRRHVTTERRRRPFWAGVGLCALGLVVLLVGAAVLWTTQTVQVLGAKARGEVGTPLRFDADPGDYSVVLLSNPLVRRDQDNAIVRIRCAVTTPDGARRRLDTTSRLETTLGRELASFNTEAGAATVRCRWKDSASTEGYVYAVAPRHTTVEGVGTGLTAAGVLLALLGVPLIVIGVRGRAVMHRGT